MKHFVIGAGIAAALVGLVVLGFDIWLRWPPKARRKKAA